MEAVTRWPRKRGQAASRQSLLPALVPRTTCGAPRKQDSIFTWLNPSTSRSYELFSTGSPRRWLIFDSLRFKLTQLQPESRDGLDAGVPAESFCRRPARTGVGRIEMRAVINANVRPVNQSATEPAREQRYVNADPPERHCRRTRYRRAWPAHKPADDE